MQTLAPIRRYFTARRARSLKVREAEVGKQLAAEAIWNDGYQHALDAAARAFCAGQLRDLMERNGITGLDQVPDQVLLAAAGQ